MGNLATGGHNCIKQMLQWILPAVFISLFASSIRAEGLIQAELRIPATFGKSGNQTLQLEAFVVRPDDQQAHPLVIINHGSPRKPAERKTVSPHKFIPQAIEFARRGWTAVVVIRRGLWNCRPDHRSAARAGGGRASLIQAPAFGDDGHHLFSRSKGIPVWTPYIDDFLKQQGLMRREPLISAGTSHDIRPPKGLSSSGLAAFKEYLTAPAHKAFAVSNNDSGYGWRSGRRSLEEAESEAIANCEKHGHDRECEVYMADDKLKE